MRYLVIGLGIYGTNLAVDLTDMGHEVIGADIRSSNVEAVKDYISTAYVLDSTDEQALGVLPLKKVDLVIVAIGENFGASVKTVALLKKLGVKHLYARAIDKLHESILEGLNIDRIITPEQRAARDLAHELELGTDVDVLKVDEHNMVMKFKIPDSFVGLKYSDLNFEKNYGLKLVAVTRSKTINNIMGLFRQSQVLIEPSSQTIEKSDIITVFGSIKAYRELYHAIN